MPGMQIDTSSGFGRRVQERLENEQVIWLTTVAADGSPQPSPVWFLWDGQQVLMYSMPNTPKLRHMQANPKVALNFDSQDGGDVVILTGQAQVAQSEAAANGNPAYLDKYREAIGEIGMNPDAFAQTYSVAVRITPTRLRGHL
jgi:PPOX class probable F420-dependent enzyme